MNYPEGILFFKLNQEKITNIKKFREEKLEKRKEILGFVTKRV